jgi:hypothetical protein
MARVTKMRMRGFLSVEGVDTNGKVVIKKGVSNKIHLGTSDMVIYFQHGLWYNYLNATNPLSYTGPVFAQLGSDNSTAPTFTGGLKAAFEATGTPIPPNNISCRYFNSALSYLPPIDGGAGISLSVMTNSAQAAAPSTIYMYWSYANSINNAPASMQIGEVGICNVPGTVYPLNNLFARAVLATPITKTTNVSLRFTYQLNLLTV